MAIDFGDTPTGTPPTSGQIQQIKDVILLGNVEDIALSTWSGSTNLNTVGNIAISASNVVNFTTTVNSIVSPTLSSYPKWNSVYTTVLANSASWSTSSGDTQASTKVRSASANWDSVYTTVRASSAAWSSGITYTIPISSGGTGATSISAARTNFKTPASDNTGTAGGIEVTNVLVISQSAYDILTPNPTTLYHII